MAIKQEYKQEVFFTIVIPTRERSDTLIHTLATALAQDYGNFEVLVSDNASMDETYEKVLAIKDARLRYINTGKRVSMSENWEFAFNHVHKGWVTVLGDDDAILPGSLKIANDIINKTGTSAIRSNGCSYEWPGLTGSAYGRLVVSLRRGYTIRDSRRMLQDVIDGRLSYNELPMLYNGGFISTELIRQAKQITGNFFQSMTPDVYSAIVFSFLTKNYVYSYEPLAINGASIHSGGTAAFEKIKRTRSYDPAEKFWNEKNIPFHADLPLVKSGRPVRSIPVCVYEAFLQAKKFHDMKNIKTSHAQQLRITLDKSGPDNAEIIEWANLFASKHNLSVKNKSPFFTLDIAPKIIKFYIRLLNRIWSYRMEGIVRLGLRNVFEASVVAGMIKLIRPSRAKNILQWLKKRVKDA